MVASLREKSKLIYRSPKIYRQKSGAESTDGAFVPYAQWVVFSSDIMHTGVNRHLCEHVGEVKRAGGGHGLLGISRPAAW